MTRTNALPYLLISHLVFDGDIPLGLIVEVITLIFLVALYRQTDRQTDSHYLCRHQARGLLLGSWISNHSPRRRRQQQLIQAQLPLQRRSEDKSCIVVVCLGFMSCPWQVYYWINMPFEDLWCGSSPCRRRLCHPHQ